MQGLLRWLRSSSTAAEVANERAMAVAPFCKHVTKENPAECLMAPPSAVTKYKRKDCAVLLSQETQA
jgi:hypothetical protein